MRPDLMGPNQPDRFDSSYTSSYDHPRTPLFVIGQWSAIGIESTSGWIRSILIPDMFHPLSFILFVCDCHALPNEKSSLLLPVTL